MCLIILHGRFHLTGLWTGTKSVCNMVFGTPAPGIFGTIATRNQTMQRLWLAFYWEKSFSKKNTLARVPNFPKQKIFREQPVASREQPEATNQQNCCPSISNWMNQLGVFCTWTTIFIYDWWYDTFRHTRSKRGSKRIHWVHD